MISFKKHNKKKMVNSYLHSGCPNPNLFIVIHSSSFQLLEDTSGETWNESESNPKFWRILIRTDMSC